jgi:hypothetical protein
MGWTDLFDGESLDGWQNTGDDDNWAVDGGELVCLGTGGGYLRTEETYDDYELELEFLLTPDANSGVFLHLSDPEDPVNTGVEVQLLDSHGEDPYKHACGALYDLVAPAADAVRPAGEWNDLRVTCEGSRIVEDLNGERVVEADLSRWTEAGRSPDGSENKFDYAWADLPHEGYVALQDHTDEVRFRDIRIDSDTA